MRSEAEILAAVRAARIMPVVAVPEAKFAVPLAKTFAENGLPLAEVTFRTACASEVISAMHAAYPEMLLGAGTVLEVGQVTAAKAAGADFLVSPGYDAEILAEARKEGILYIPGVSNATEITTCLKAGLRVLKFFPAGILGGAKAIKAYHGPFSDIAFIPTGGINLDNVGEYLALPYVVACGGTFIAKSDDIQAGAWEKIGEICRRCGEFK